MKDKEKQILQSFICNIIDKDYANAEKTLQDAVEEKLKNKIRAEFSNTGQKKSTE